MPRDWFRDLERLKRSQSVPQPQMSSYNRPFTGKLAGKDLVRFEVDYPGLRLAAIQMVNIRVSSSDPAFEEYEEDAFTRIRSEMTLDGLKDNPTFRSFRDLYWTFGMDPTKLRVSSEALLRRILVGQNLWRVNNVVDVANLASAVHKLPIGLTDVSKLVGNIVVRSAKNGEVFHKIGGGTMVCRGREIVVADSEKIVCFGYATHDSDLTKVTERTNEVLMLVYGSPHVNPDGINAALSITSSMVEQWLHCRIAGRQVFYS